MRSAWAATARAGAVIIIIMIIITPAMLLGAVYECLQTYTGSWMREGVGWRVMAVCAPRPARDHLLGELPQLEPGVGVLRERDEVVVSAIEIQDDGVDLPHHVLPPRQARQRQARAAGRTRGHRKTPSYKTDSLYGKPERA
jgi:hypothetical protein